MSKSKKKVVRKQTLVDEVLENSTIRDSTAAESIESQQLQTPILRATHLDSFQSLATPTNSPKEHEKSSKKAKRGAQEENSSKIDFSEDSEADMENEPTGVLPSTSSSNPPSMAEKMLQNPSTGGNNLPIFPNSQQNIQNSLLEAELPNLYFPSKDVQSLMEELQGKNSNEHSTSLFLFLMKCFSALCHQNSLTYDLIRESFYKAEDQNMQLKLLLEKMAENLKTVQNKVEGLITVKGGNGNFSQVNPVLQNSNVKFQNSGIRIPTFARDPTTQVELQIEVPSKDPSMPFPMETSRKNPMETSRKKKPWKFLEIPWKLLEKTPWKLPEKTLLLIFPLPQIAHTWAPIP
jgi:hypothetical protein